MKISDIVEIGWGDCEIVRYDYDTYIPNSDEQQVTGFVFKKNEKYYEIRAKDKGELEVVEV